MKSIKFIFLTYLILLICASWTLSQDEIKWEFNYDTNAQQLSYKANLKEGWHIYSQFIDENSGPVANTFDLEENDLIEVSKEIEEPEGVTIFDKNFGSEITYFSDEVVFYQKVSKIYNSTTVKGSVLYMICNDEGCLPPEVVEFKTEIKG